MRGDPGYGRHSKCVQKMNHDECHGSFSLFLRSFHPTDRPSTQRQQTRATTFVVVRFGYTTLIPSHRPPPFLTPAYIECPSLQATFEPVYHPSPAPPPPPRLYYGLTMTPITFDDIEMGSTMVRRVRQHRYGFDDSRGVRRQPDGFDGGQNGSTEPDDGAVGHQTCRRAEQRGRANDEGKEEI